MKIVEQTPNRLKLQANNLGVMLGLVLGGSSSLLIGLPIMLFSDGLTTLKCQRVEPTQGSCQLVHSRLLGSDETQISLNQLQGAKVDSGESTYRVVLLTQEGEVPFTSALTSGHEGKQRNADRINVFIHNPGETSLSIQQDDRLMLYLLGGLFPLAGGVIFNSLLATEYIQTCTFDKDQGRICLKGQSLRRTQVTERMLREINQVEVKEDRDSDGHRTYSIRLNLKSGEYIPLPGTRYKKRNQKTAECIRQFLNLKA